MTTVLVDPNGEATLRKAVLEAAGARAGDTLEVQVRVVGHARRGSAAKPVTWSDLAGGLVSPTGVRLTIEQMNDAIAEAGAEAGMAGFESCAA